jgi:hypothetical protein
MQTQHASPAGYIPIGHSNEVEHRLTVLEQAVIVQREALTKMDKRMTLQERGLLVLFISVTAIAHERIPWLAKALVGLVKSAPI